MKVPLICGWVALSALLFKLPGFPELFGMTRCHSCSTDTPYIPMLAAGYFAGFITSILSFKRLPTPILKWGGIIWAVGLSICLTFLSPRLCYICLIAHASHITMWIFWKPRQTLPETMKGMKGALVITSSFAVMALFSTLNFTFLVYGLQVKNPLQTLAKVGVKAKPFQLKTVENQDLSTKTLEQHKGIILNFVSSNCPYCEQQIPQLNALAQELLFPDFRFINITHPITPELKSLGPDLEWVEDSEMHLASLFGVSGYPTLILLDPLGVVVNVIAGSSSNLEIGMKSQLTQLLTLHKKGK